MIDRWRALPPYPRRVLARLACVPLLWFLGTVAVFMVMVVWAEPPDVATAPPSTDEQLEQLRKALGLDRSYFEQYTDWLTNLFTGDFGEDYTGRSIRTEVWNRLEPTVSALLLALGFSALLAFAFAWASRSGTSARLASRAAMAAFASVPIAIAGIAYILLPARWWQFGLPVGAEPSILGDRSDFILLIVVPSFVCGTIAAGFTAAAVGRYLEASDWSGTAILRAIGASVCGSLPILISCLVVVDSLLSIDSLGGYLFRIMIVREYNPAQTLMAIVLLVSLVAWAFHPDDPRPSVVAEESQPSRWLLAPGLALASLFLVAAIVGPLFGDDVRDISADSRLLPVSLAHPFGTDNLGRDQLEQVIAGSRTSLKYALVPIIFGFLPGLALAVASTRLGSTARTFQREAASIWQAMPLLPIVLLVASNFYESFWHVTITLALSGFAIAFIVWRSEEPIDLARPEHRRAVGWAALAGVSMVAGIAILAEFTLAFLGVHSFEAVSLGFIVSQSARDGVFHMYLWIIPSLIFIAILCGLMLIRRSLDDAVPPQIYER